MLSYWNRLYCLLEAYQKKQIGWILLVIFFQAIIEALTIAAILPFLAVVGAPTLVQSNKILSTLYAMAPVSSVPQFMIFLGTVFFSIIVVGNLFSAFATWYFLRFSMRCGYELSSKLFKSYLFQPYAFFVLHHSSALINNILTEVSRVILGMLINLLQLFSRIAVISFIVVLLVAVDWKLALSVVTVLGTAYVCAFLAIRKKLKKAGQLSSYCNTKRHRALIEAFSVMKELKLLGRELYFYNIFRKFSEIYVQNETDSQILPPISRYFIEIVAFGGILLIVLYLLVTQQDLQQALPFLGLYALAGYRLMPALQQIFASVSTIRYHSHALAVVEHELARPVFAVSDNVKPLVFKDQIEFRELSFQYEGATTPAIVDLNLSIEKNSSVGIVGASGAGKTTLVDLLLGLFLGTKGAIYIDNQCLQEDNMGAWRRCVGYVPQTIRLIDNTIKNNIALGISDEAIDLVRVKKVATMAGVADFIESLPQQYDTLVGEEGARLSGGQKQRIGIARALYHDPKILVLDEATSALDGFSEQMIIDTLKRLKHEKTIVIVAHRLSTVKHCEKIVMMENGKRIDEGSYVELFDRNAQFHQMAAAMIGVASTIGENNGDCI